MWTLSCGWSLRRLAVDCSNAMAASFHVGPMNILVCIGFDANAVLSAASKLTHAALHAKPE
jgi:hypothetical protein